MKENYQTSNRKDRIDRSGVMTTGRASSTVDLHKDLKEGDVARKGSERTAQSYSLLLRQTPRCFVRK